MSTAVSRPAQPPIETFKSLIERNRASIEAVIPAHMRPEKLMKVALVACSRSPDLLECTPRSILQAVMVSAQLGLDCGGVLGEAYLVPFNVKVGKGRDERWEKQATLIPGYRGLISLARRSGQIASIESHVVRQGDDFEFSYGYQPVFRHTPFAEGEDALRDGAYVGNIVAAWAMARFKDGTVQLEVMRTWEIERIRKISKQAEGATWRHHYAEMARKTVVRRLVKYLPLSVEMAAAIHADDRADLGLPAAPSMELLPESFDGTGEIEDVAPAQPAADTPQARARATLQAPAQPEQQPAPERQAPAREEEQENRQGAQENEADRQEGEAFDPVKRTVIQAYGLAGDLDAWRRVGEGVPEALQKDPDVVRVKMENRNRLIKDRARKA